MIYHRFLSFLGENVLRCLRRLGGKKKPMSSKDRWKKKKQQLTETEEKENAIEMKQKEALLKLTELADTLLQNGDFQAYEKTYEQIAYEVKSKEDQFADAVEDEEDDELEAAFKGAGDEGVQDKQTGNEVSKPENEAVQVENEADDDTGVRWMYRVEDSDASELLGPFSSSKMLEWQEGGKFEKPVYCRKVGSDGSFYNSNRIDFDLYI